MNKHFFITGTGTGVGKTFFTAALTKQLIAEGKTVAALKPVISGYVQGDNTTDTALLQAATSANIEAISPWRFHAPLSPNMAAKLENTTLELEKILAFCQQPRAEEILLCEGVGGVMVPLNDTHTTLDWMKALNWPVIVVGGSYLGAISHTLTALETLRSRGIAAHRLVVSESENSNVDFAETCLTLQQHLPVTLPVVKLPRTHIPPLTQIIL
jgi:dethiobiotin synthetase